MKPLRENRFTEFLKSGTYYYLLRLVIAIQVIIVFASVIVNVWLALFTTFLFVLMDMYLWKNSKQAVQDFNSYISNLSYSIKRGENEAIIKLPIGIIIYNEVFEIEWLSPYLQMKSKDEDPLIGKNIEKVFPGIKKALKEENPLDKVIKWKNNYYRISVESDIKSIYFENISKYMEVKKEREENRAVVGWLFLDNYDEVIKGLDDRAVSSFNSLLTTYISNWSQQYDIYYKRVDDDKYLLLLRREELNRLEKEKFSIVNNIREYTSKRNVPLTISIGLSYGESSFRELEKLAQKDLDLALGRGGDQAIVREINQEPRYYGGTTNPMEKRTRVRSRVISEALQEQIQESPTTYIVGHKFPDMDSVGSALGIARIAMMLERECKVIIDQDKIGTDVKKLLEKVERYHETYKNIISSEEALEKIQSDDLLVMVDHHKPSMSIAPYIDEKTNKVAIIDHHRRGDEFPEKPILVYIEPYASSAAELITELFEYISTDSNTINRIEATSMLAGIIVDTNNFTLRTGSRTFDAASYLQSVGANTVTIQRILKENPKDYLKRMDILQNFEFVSEGIAIAHAKEGDYYRQVLAAQTADTMLSMTDVEASFAIVRLNDEKIGISARSLGKINVQRIMEELGGGGHLTNAATQIKDKSIAEVKEELTEVIKKLNN